MRIWFAIRTHWIFFLILALATVLRVHSISSQMIFVGDQGRDALVAKEMVELGHVPLLGIPSSIPRFKQGPLFIYFLAITYWLSHGSILAMGLLASAFGLAAIVALYLLVATYDSVRTATLAALLFSLLPMLILHSRMPYHIVPIPLFVCIFLWQIVRFARGEKWAAFGAGLAFALVFQFELAAFPLILLIPLVKMKQTWPSRSQLVRTLPIGLGLAIGLLPQIVFDLTHQFAQLGGFAVWVGYKIVTALLPFTKNSLTDGGSGAKIQDLIKLFVSLFTQNGIAMDQWLWLSIIVLCAGICVWTWRKSNLLSRIVGASSCILAVGLVIHRVPSEAYIPLLAPSVTMMIASGLRKINRNVGVFLTLVLFTSLALSAKHLEMNTFFLLQTNESNWGDKRFGPSIGTQQHIVDSLFTLAGNRCIILESLERDATFPTLYNHLEYLIAIDSRTQGPDCARFRIDRPEEAKRRWIDQGNVIDLGAYWVRELDSQKVYAKAY